MHCAAGSDWCRPLRQTFWGRQARPAMALAATVAGLARWVWLLGPSGPSKFPVELGMHRSSGPTKPSLIATHIERPASRHSKPASLKMRSKPRASAVWRTRLEPRTINAPHAGRHFAVLDDAGGCLELLEPAVGAGSDEGHIDLHPSRGQIRHPSHAVG